jgi:phytoene synthase
LRWRRTLSPALDLVIADVRQRDRDRYLALLYAPEAVRPALFALHGLDLELASVVIGTSEPMIGAIRLAWWREALQGLGTGAVPAQPLLQLIAAQLLGRGISCDALAALEARWCEMIGTTDIPDAHVEGGSQLFGLSARLLDGDEALGGLLGRAWVLGDDSGLQPATKPQRATPTALRPLLGLVRLAQRDAARARTGRGPETRGGLGRQLVLLKAIALGR